MVRVASLLSFLFVWSGMLGAGDVPRPAAPLIVKTLDGGQISLESFRGKVVLLEFFLTECPHCQRTAPHIVSVYRDWRPRGLEVLAVAINPDAKQRVPEFVQRFGINYRIGLGDTTMVKTFLDMSAVRNFFVPYMVLIDRRGVVRYEHDGGDAAFYGKEPASLRSELDTLLKEPAPTRKAGIKTSRRTS